ncbi:J domain-containing protein [Frankia sp. R82]|uniref:J domain-containing protein n=1 Tax=Frankia sp. R82 TaxID=2950553 RepID=UPI002043DB7F|nr:J domain-containing protein [Frankia sp. R82]MCM3887120.1 J domain-containing protein [Frankia sp. R82]
MAAQPSLYEVLGIPPDASADQIRHAYRLAARRTHPDAGGRPAAFAQVRVAYDVLADPDRRRRYDLRLAAAARSPFATARPSSRRSGPPSSAGSPWPSGTPGTTTAGTPGMSAAGPAASGTSRPTGMAAPPPGALLAGNDPVVRRRYLILMGISLALFITGGTFVRLYSVPAAMAMLAVAAIIPPIAVTVAGRPRHHGDRPPRRESHTPRR